MLDQMVYTLVEATTQEDLLQEIGRKTRELSHTYQEVWVQSVSHDAAVMPSGNIIWTAIITCEVMGHGDKEETN